MLKQNYGYLTGEAEVRRLAELRDKWESDWNSSMEWARTKGEEKGKVEGKKENQKEIAKNLLNMGISVKQIIEATGLTKEEIDKL